jgi:anti-anti-sigma factor
VTQFEIDAVSDSRFRLSGELDMASAPTLQDALRPVVDACRSLTLDLEDLTFIDSSGIRAFVLLAGRLDGSAPLVLTNVPNGVLRLLDIVGLETLPNIEVRPDA